MQESTNNLPKSSFTACQIDEIMWMTSTKSWPHSMTRSRRLRPETKCLTASLAWTSKNESRKLNVCKNFLNMTTAGRGAEPYR